MKRVKFVIVVIAVGTVAALAGGAVGGGAAIALIRSAYNGPEKTETVHQITVQSDALSQAVSLGVRFPLEYSSSSDMDFPVIWVLDGPGHGAMIAETQTTLSRIGLVPPAIIVEVPSSNAGRTVDFTPDPYDSSIDGSADRFMKFLSQEAFPAVTSSITSSSVNILVGHSLGGLFALYVLLEQPSLFDAYFAFSPSTWVADQAIVEAYGAFNDGSVSSKPDLYTSLGSSEGNEMSTGFSALVSVLESRVDIVDRWEAEWIDHADHLTNPQLSYPVAATWYWSR